jgi:hypothetical protein
VKKLIPILFLILGGCGYEGHYRYKCQDPINWKINECNPPECKVSGTCTIDIIGFDPEEQPEGETDE